MAQGLIRSFWHDANGAVAATYAIALVGLIAVAGVGFDYSRMAGLDSELQNGADQAALAASTQLDKQNGACSRASNAAVSLLRNLTLLSNDGGGNLVEVNAGSAPGVADDACGDLGYITFYSSYTDPATNTIATTDKEARFVKVAIDERTARYAFTPIVGAIFNTMYARAVAGIGSAICRVPPMMICAPTDGASFNAAAKVGWGVQASGGTSWAPGDFGFLEVGSGQTAVLAKSIALGTSFLDCVSTDKETLPETGNAQVIYDAINTRFDIQPQNSSGGATLAACANGLCPAALNVVKDVVKPDTNINGNKCKLKAPGDWELPHESQRFDPQGFTASTIPSRNTAVARQAISAMGLTRDLCHYTGYGVSCSAVNGGLNNKFGNSQWAIKDYFNKYHPTYTLNTAKPTVKPATFTDSAYPHAFMTRYEVYRWELANSRVPGKDGYPAQGLQRGGRICQLGDAAGIDRRVLTVAVVKNCGSLSGGSVPVDVDEWVDMFLVEPVVDDNVERTRGRPSDSIYMEVIGPATLGNSAAAATQTVRRDKPYLLE